MERAPLRRAVRTAALNVVLVFLVAALLVAVMFGLGGVLGGVEVTILYALVVAAWAWIIVRAVRRYRQDRRELAMRRN